MQQLQKKKGKKCNDFLWNSIAGLTTPLARGYRAQRELLRTSEVGSGSKVNHSAASLPPTCTAKSNMLTVCALAEE